MQGCPEPGLEHTNLHDIECDLTSGRRAFANGDYEKAARFWDTVIHATPVTKREKVLIGVAHGTLGFLFYNGLGVQRDRDKALDLYKKGVKLGDTESRTHLGDAYMDQNNGFRDPVIAYAWFASIERYKHESLPGYEDIDREIIDSAKKAVSTLKIELTPEQLAKAENLINELK